MDADSGVCAVDSRITEDKVEEVEGNKVRNGLSCLVAEGTR